MPLVQTAAPAIEPVSLAEVKTHSRITTSDEDGLLAMLISAARRYAESQTGRSFITQSWRLVLDGFPGCYDGDVYGRAFSAFPTNAVLFEKGPVQSVTSIVYTDMGGATQTVTPAAPDYAIDLTGPIPRMTPGFGKVWPIPLPQIGAVQVNYIAGYGPAATDVPEGIRHWMLMRIATIYENREEVAVLGRGGKVEQLPFVDNLLDPYRILL